MRRTADGSVTGLLAAALGLTLLVAGGANAQTTVPPVFIPYETANQRFFGGRFDNNIQGFFNFVSDGVFFQLFPRLNQGFQNFVDEASAAVDEVPIPSGSVSVAYEFDPKLETFVRLKRPFAPALSLNARTDGRGVFTIGTSYSYVDYQNFDGQDRNDVVFPAPLNATDELGRPISDQALFQFKLVQNIVSVAFSYGVLDNLDVGILIPMISEHFHGQMIDRFFSQNPDGSFVPASLLISPDGSFAFRSDNRLPPVKKITLQAYDNPAGDLPNPGFVFKENIFGIGDLVLRSKAFFGSLGLVDFGGALNLALPTGDENQLLGVGSVRLEPRLLVSTATDRFAMHTNLGVHVDTDESDRDRFDYSVGGEVLLAPRVTLLVDQVGLLEFSGNDQIRKYDIVPGIKVNVYRTLVVGFNAIVPLNQSGLRTDFTPNATLEVSTVF